MAASSSLDLPNLVIEVDKKTSLGCVRNAENDDLWRSQKFHVDLIDRGQRWSISTSELETCIKVLLNRENAPDWRSFMFQVECLVNCLSCYYCGSETGINF